MVESSPRLGVTIAGALAELTGGAADSLVERFRLQAAVVSETAAMSATKTDLKLHEFMG
jgi:hypothetical protein